VRPLVDLDRFHRTVCPARTAPMKVPPAIEKKIDKVIRHYPESPSAAALPVLHLLQHEFGYLDEKSVQYAAGKVGVDPIRILELVSFYPGFRQDKPGKYHIRVCRTLSCAMAGSEELMESLCKAARIDRSETSHHHPIAKSKNGKYSIEFAECLASCGTGPVCLVNDEFHEDVAPGSVKDLLAKYK